MPIGYAAGQVLAQAVTETKSLDHDKLAEYMHKAKFKTVVGRRRFRQGRRMDETAAVRDAVPERRAEQSRPVPRRQSAANNLARRCQNGKSDLPIR